ncbi:MAG: hypothetical protein WCY09_09675 [Candidatus Omnitrophota bacterium]
MEEEMVVPEAVEEVIETPDVGGVSEETPAAEPSVDAPKPVATDVDKLRSVYDRKLAEMQQRESQFQAYLDQLRQADVAKEQKLFELETRDMDEQQKQLYAYQREAESVKQQLAAIQQEREQERMTAQAYAAREQKIRAFSEKSGIPFDKLDAQIQTPQDLTKAFWDHYESLQTAARQAPAAAPKVSVAKPGSPARGLASKINIHDPSSYQDIISRALAGDLSPDEL